MSLVFFSPFKKMSVPAWEELFDFHGVPMIQCFTSNWRKVESFQARPDDILIATSPKAGLFSVGTTENLQNVCFAVFYFVTQYLKKWKPNNVMPLEEALLCLADDVRSSTGTFIVHYNLFGLFGVRDKINWWSTRVSLSHRYHRW